MKRLIPVIVMVVLLASCKSIEKLVEQGKYDEAIILATKKLAGKKDKKTEHIMALEDAFAKVSDRDLQEIQYLKIQPVYGKWDKIHSIYNKMRSRQNRISAFLPLISEDGYVAEFAFRDFNELISDAAVNASDEHYNAALDKINLARRGDKLAARDALSHLDRIDRYLRTYKDSENLKDEAYYLGKTRILVNLVNEAPIILPEAFCAHVKSVHVSDLNTIWKEYHLVEREGLQYDLYADLQILDLTISPSLETRDRWTEKREVESGWHYKKRRNGEFVKDSLGNKIKVTEYKKVHADITKTTREKTAKILGNLLFRDVQLGYAEATRPIEVIADFYNESFDYHGDKRALPKEIRNAIRTPLAFPTDFDLTMEVAENLKGLLKKELYETPHIY